MDIKEIEIPIFLHPHLFWIFWRKDSKRRIQLQNDLSKEYSGINQEYVEFNVGEIVVVRKNLIWKRATIENKVEGNTYEVWLIDYGHLEHTSTVYKLNPKFDLNKLPPLVHEACLWNVVYLNENLNIEDNSIVQHKNISPNAGATLNALQCMSDFQLFFKKTKEVNGTLFGDIMYKKDGETSSLTKALIDKNLMIEDAELFSKVVFGRTNYKVLYSVALRQASKKHEDSRFSFDLSLLMDEVFMRSTSRGISLVNNSQIQSNKSNSSIKNIPKSELIKNLRKKSEARKMESLSCTESDREDMLVEGGRTSSGNRENQFSKAAMLRRLINRKKAALENQSCTEEVTSGSEANANGDNGSSVVSKLAALKLRTREMESKENLVDSKGGQSKDNIPEPKLLKVENSIFIPEGLRTLPNKEKKSSHTSSISEMSDSVESVTNRKCTFAKDFKGKEEINKSTKEENFSKSRNIMIRKLVERTKNALSNTSDASDADMINTIESQKCSIEKNISNINKNETSCEESISGNIRKDPFTNESNNSVESNASDNSNFENSKKSLGEQKKAVTKREYNDDSTLKPQNAVDSQMVVTPFCNCSQCQFWTSSEGWDIGNENFTEEQKCKRKQMRPPSLMLKEPREEDVKLASIDYKFMTKLEKNASFKILVHGRLIPPGVDRVVEAPFHPTIHKTLSKLKYVRTKKIQSYIWPAITRSMNVYYVNRKKSGKTLAYLPPLCSFLLEREERYSDLKKGGPIAIVLEKSSTECEEIYDLANKLVGGDGHNKPRILLVTYPFQYVNLSSVDMLITIPPILIELLKKNATNFKRLCHLVLENLDVLLLKYSDEMKSIIAAVESMLLQRTIRQNVQMIMNGEHWTLKVEKFLTNLRDIPLIAIGDYLEAAIYGGIKLKVKLLEAKAKCDAVVDILKDKWKYYKSIIICNANEEIEQLKTVLDLASITYISVTDDLPTEQIYQNESNWESNCGGQYNVLICTDLVLHTMLSITSASLIIHFSLPSKWSLWLKRFYCLLENYTSPLKKKNDNLKCEGYILTDELCVDQIPRLLLLLKNYNVSLNQFEPVCKQMEIEKEEVKIAAELPLCSSLKQFGYCHTVNYCPDRHLLDRDLDCNSSLPQNGTIKYKILKLIDVNHLKVNISEHKDTEGKITEYKSQKNLDDDKLTSLLKLNKARAECIEENSSYAYWDEDDFNDMFRECLVENIKNDVVEILVKDNGRRTTVSKSKIFQLPDKFNRENDMNSCSTNVIIANFKPPYKDENFSARAFFKLNGYIEDVGYNDSIFVSNICLQLGDTIWVNTISEEIKVYDLSLKKSNLNKELVKRQLAEINREHIENLYLKCKSAGIVLPKYDIPMEEQLLREPAQEKPQWAFLEMDVCNKVYFSSAVSLNEIYVRLAKFDSLLINLEKDMSDVAHRQGSKQNFAIVEGRYYLAKEPVEDRYTRVLIIRIKGDNALCFSVDYGDETVVPLKDIRYLSNYMIKKLPFQAIQCRLFGIKSIEDDEAVDILYKKFTFETETKFYRTLFAECVLYEKGMNKGQSFFSILLKDVVEKPILLNQLFIDCGWAALIPGAIIRDFEVPVSESEEDICTEEEEESNDLEKIKEIVETSKSIPSNQIVPKSSLGNFENMEENDELELFFGSGDEVDNFIDFMNAMNNASQEVESKASNTLPAIEAAPFEVDYLTPDVYWSQTKKKIEIIIRLPNVITYNVKVLKSNIFNFQTTVDEKKYVVNLVLYQSVEKDFTHKLGGLEVKITLNKNKEEEWPKLSRSKNRLRNVHYLLSKEELEYEENDEKLFLDFGKDLADLTDSESDDAIFDVYSDRDSEYEQELPEEVDL